ncbi:MAG: hypothetical protein ABJB97_12990 [Acidobacteriota bacterium]
MRTIGFFGGPTISELGPVADVQLFFDCINSLVVPAAPDRNWSLLTDRLYRRYLRREELVPAQALMDEVQTRFSTIPSSTVNWSNITTSAAVSRLDPSKATLAEVFSAYFDRFARCRESAEIFFHTWQSYQPLKIVIVDLPDSVTDQDRLPEEYESLEGEPFWKG